MRKQSAETFARPAGTGRSAGAALLATALLAGTVLAASWSMAQAQPRHCPPGLADKGCVPPGQAKKWAVGQILPPDLVYVPARYHSPPPPGTAYVRVDEDLLLITEATRRIVRILSTN